MRAPSLCDKLGTGRAMPHDTERTLKGEVDLRRIPAKMNGFCALACTPLRLEWPSMLGRTQPHVYLFAVFWKEKKRSNHPTSTCPGILQDWRGMNAASSRLPFHQNPWRLRVSPRTHSGWQAEGASHGDRDSDALTGPGRLAATRTRAGRGGRRGFASRSTGLAGRVRHLFCIDIRDPRDEARVPQAG
jgi:hypothetical protein